MPRNAIHPILLTSIPKAGTHLLASILDSFGLHRKRIFLARNLRNNPINNLFWKSSQECLVGLGQPQPIKIQTLQLLLKLTQNGAYRMGHLPYQNKIVQLLHQMEFKILFAFRDPRDIVVSQVYYYLDHPKHYLHPYYKSITSKEERLSMAIKGIFQDGRWITFGVAKKLQLAFGWMTEPHVLPIRFEEIIGHRGGGQSINQENEINRLANFLGMDIYPKRSKDIGNQVFGRGVTFRRGQIGEWKKHFTPYLIELFKIEAGDSLINFGYESNLNW